MKILLLSTGGKIGGEETFTRNLAIALTARGHYVEVCPGGIIQKEDLQSNHIPICPVDITGRTPWALYKSAKKLTSYIKENSFDVIHAQAVGPAIMGVLAKRFFHCPTPWIWHNHGITTKAYKYIVPRLDKLDLCISNSDYVYVMMLNHGISYQKSKRIHNGINSIAFCTKTEEKKQWRNGICKSFNIPSSDKIIIYVGRLSPEKGVTILLKSFDTLYTQNNNVSCLLVGDGIQRNELERFANESKAKNKIHFAGFRKDVKELVAASDILVLPSLIETFSLTTLQAFAIGTPVIASDVGGNPEQVLDKFNGLLFKSEDSDDLLHKLDYLISNETECEAFAKRAKILVDTYLNEDRMIDDIENVYITLTK